MAIDKGLAASLERMLTTLERKVDPSHAALLVVDMQNEWIGPDGYTAKEGFDLTLINAVVPRIKKLLDKARKAGVPVIHIGQISSSENNWYLSDVFLEHFQRTHKGAFIKFPVCEKGSSMIDFNSELQPLPGEAVVFKHRYSAFMHTDLDLILRSKRIRTLIISGIDTDVCAGATARHGFLNNYYIVFLKDCTATTSEEEHNNELKAIANWYGEVVDSKDVFRCWEKSRQG